ncbi:MAG: hypothetical protein JXA57_10630 [Armatimonadetes bacterium]|nr:hypothetical protein [Armatimonadota bacterium]
MFEAYLVSDNGCNGCLFVGRIGTSGPEVMSRPLTWWHRTSARYERHEEYILSHARLLVQEYHPRFFVMEDPKSILGRRHVVRSQAWKAGRLQMAVEHCPNAPQTILVPGQGPAKARTAWGILRVSLSEIVDRDEMRKLSRIGKGEPGENVADAFAVFLAGVSEREGMRRGE